MGVGGGGVGVIVLGYVLGYEIISMILLRYEIF